MGNQNSSKDNEILNLESTQLTNRFINMEEKKVKQLHDTSYYKDNISYNGISSDYSSPKEKIKISRKSFFYKDNFDSTDEEKPNEEKKEDTVEVTKNVSTLFEWKEEGENVYLTGSFVNWEQKFLLKQNYTEHKFEISLELPRGKYEYKFVVDEVWKFSKFHPTIKDQKGNINNFIDNTNSSGDSTSRWNNQSEVEKTKRANFNNFEDESYKKLFKDNEDIDNNEEKKVDRERYECNFRNKYYFLDEKKCDKSRNRKKEKEEYFCYLPRKVELNTDAVVCPDPYRDLYNINLSSRQTQLGNCEFLRFSDTVYGAGNTSFLSIASSPHVNLNHICTKMINNDKGVIVSSSTQRTCEKVLTIIYYRPVRYMIKRKK